MHELCRSVSFVLWDQVSYSQDEDLVDLGGSMSFLCVCVSVGERGEGASVGVSG